MDRGALWATVHEVTKSWHNWVTNTFTFHSPREVKFRGKIISLFTDSSTLPPKKWVDLKKLEFILHINYEKWTQTNFYNWTRCLNFALKDSHIIITSENSLCIQIDYSRQMSNWEFSKKDHLTNRLEIYDYFWWLNLGTSLCYEFQTQRFVDWFFYSNCLMSIHDFSVARL